MRYRGRVVTDADVAFIANLVTQHPDASRYALSRRLCAKWQWVQPNGAPCDALARGLMLALHRGGHIVLPPAKRAQVDSSTVHRAPTPVELPEVALSVPLRQLGPLTIQQVRRTPAEALVMGLIERYHYLRYARPVGEHLKYLVSAGGQPIACFAWSSAPLYLGPRDRHIGWSAAARQNNLRLVAYQSRFLILPWVKVPHLASHLLGRMARQLSADWERLYAHPIYFTETFVDPSRYRGTCYRAANWMYLGMTSGRGKDAPTRAPTRPPKMVFGYPLVADFQRRLCALG